MSDLEQVIEEALSLGDQGRWQEMAELLTRALDDAPDDPYVLCWLGMAERELDNEGRAYELFKQGLASDPIDPHLLAMAGAGLAAVDDPDAEPALTKLFCINFSFRITINEFSNIHLYTFGSFHQVQKLFPCIWTSIWITMV
jgi:tetratricopeptide (TPR) repeat protein